MSLILYLEKIGSKLQTQTLSETFAVAVSVFLFFFPHSLGAIVWVMLSFSQLCPVALIYACYIYFLELQRSSNGGRS